MTHLFHRLDGPAFDGAVDPRAPVLSASVAGALAELEEGLARGDAVLLLTGPPGVGKTTLARVLAARAAPAGVRTVFVHHPQLGFEDLLRLIAEEIGLPARAPDAPFERLRAVQRRLVQALARGGRLLVVIDEAQELPDETLESLRLLATLEAGPHARPLQVLLAGHPELDRRLRGRRYRALEQRVGARATLVPLAQGEACDWLRARLAQAGPAAGAAVFTGPALAAIARRGGGAPRTMERLARRALAEAARRRETPVRRATVLRAAAEIAPRPGAGNRDPGRSAGGAWALAACAALALALMTAAAWRAGADHRPDGSALVARQAPPAPEPRPAAAVPAQATVEPPAEAGGEPLRAAMAVESAPPTLPAALPLARPAAAPALRPPLR